MKCKIVTVILALLCTCAARFAAGQEWRLYDSLLLEYEHGNTKAFAETKSWIHLAKVRGVIRECTLAEINSYWIVYEMHGALHDLLTEAIDHIDLGREGGYALYFSGENKIHIKLPELSGTATLPASSHHLNPTYTGLETSTQGSEYQIGSQVGERDFKGRSAFMVGLVSGLVPQAGWLSATLVAATPVANASYNAGAYNPSITDPKEQGRYMRGYRKGLHRKKARRVAAGFFVGIGLRVLITVAAL